MSVDQLVSLVVYGTLLCVIFMVPGRWPKGIAIFGMLMLFFVNPFRFSQDGAARLETVDKFSNLPSRIVIEKDSFEQRQRNELNQLKLESKESTND